MARLTAVIEDGIYKCSDGYEEPVGDYEGDPLFCPAHIKHLAEINEKPARDRFERILQRMEKDPLL